MQCFYNQSLLIKRQWEGRLWLYLKNNVWMSLASLQSFFQLMSCIDIIHWAIWSDRGEIMMGCSSTGNDATSFIMEESLLIHMGVEESGRYSWSLSVDLKRGEVLGEKWSIRGDVNQPWWSALSHRSRLCYCPIVLHGGFSVLPRQIGASQV